MNERRIASQIRFVFQSYPGRIPYWLKPNNLIRCFPEAFTSSAIPTLSLPLLLSLTVPKEKRLAVSSLSIKEALTANHSSWPQSSAFNFDDIYQSWQGYQIKKGSAGLYILPTIKTYYLPTHTSIWEKCQADKRVRVWEIIWQLDDISFDWCNIQLTKLCIYLAAIDCAKSHILYIDASLKFHEGEANLGAQRRAPAIMFAVIILQA